MLEHEEVNEVAQVHYFGDQENESSEDNLCFKIVRDTSIYTSTYFFELKMASWRAASCGPMIKRDQRFPRWREVFPFSSLES